MRRPKLLEEIGNLPNMITLGRVVLIVPVLMLIDPVDPISNFMAMALFALASFFDSVSSGSTMPAIDSGFTCEMGRRATCSDTSCGSAR